MQKDSNVEPIVLDDLVTLISSQIYSIAIGQIAVNSLLAWLAWPHVGAITVSLWLMSIIVAQLVRLSYHKPLLNNPTLSSKYKLNIFGGSSAIVGILQGLAVVIFLPTLPPISGILTVVTASMMYTAFSGTCMGYKPVLLCFSIPCLGLSAFTMIWMLISQQTFEGFAFLLFTFIIYTVVISRISATMFKNFSDSSTLRSRQTHLNSELERALTASEAANHAKTRFLASASHDLRQPMHTLSLYSAALNMQPLDEKSKVITERMNSAVSALSSQLDSLLDISKLDAGIVKTNPEPVNVSALIDRLAESYTHDLSNHAIQLNINCTDNLTINTDPVLLERILRNLLANALKFTHQGTVTISASKQNGSLALEIQDSGIGIAEQDIDKVFEEFYQVGNPERDRQKGMGLGLAIVKRLVGLLSGSINVKSTLNEGTAFTVKIAELELVTSSAITPSGKPLEWFPKRIMVVDDERDVRNSMQSLLEQLGCEVTVCADVQSSIIEFRRFTPDIVLADFRLRDNEDGVDLIKQLRSIKPHCPALLISGDIAADRLEKANREGVKLLHKPVQIEDMQQAIMQACNNAANNVQKEQQ